MQSFEKREREANAKKKIETEQKEYKDYMSAGFYEMEMK